MEFLNFLRNSSASLRKTEEILKLSFNLYHFKGITINLW